MVRVTARAHPNIALVKYWGKRDPVLNLPAVPSLSVTLDGFQTTTTVTWGVGEDRVWLDGREATPPEARRVSVFLDRVAPERPPCLVESASNFPSSAGLASSSSAFAALALAATRAAGRPMDPFALSVLARQGSGSACRSILGGFVEWRRGERMDGSDSHAVQVAPPGAWDLRVVVAVVSRGAKAVSSSEGMARTVATSPCHAAFVADAPAEVERARAAVLARDLPALCAAMERSTLGMVASMLTTRPSLRYWKPGTLAVVEQVERLRSEGIPVGWTTDAGPNVKVLCEGGHAAEVEAVLAPLALETHVLSPGPGASWVVS